MKKAIFPVMALSMCLFFNTISLQAKSQAAVSDNKRDESAEGDRKRQVIRDIIGYLIREHMVQDKASISAFLLTDTAMVVNGQKLPEARHKRLQKRYLPEPGYIIYYGNEPMAGKGIFQRTAAKRK
jgi:hypothetical protein